MSTPQNELDNHYLAMAQDAINKANEAGDTSPNSQRESIARGLRIQEMLDNASPEERKLGMKWVIENDRAMADLEAAYNSQNPIPDPPVSKYGENWMNPAKGELPGSPVQADIAHGPVSAGIIRKPTLRESLNDPISIPGSTTELDPTAIYEMGKTMSSFVPGSGWFAGLPRAGIELGAQLLDDAGPLLSSDYSLPESLFSPSAILKEGGLGYTERALGKALSAGTGVPTSVGNLAGTTPEDLAAARLLANESDTVVSKAQIAFDEMERALGVTKKAGSTLEGGKTFGQQIRRYRELNPETFTTAENAYEFTNNLVRQLGGSLKKPGANYSEEVKGILPQKFDIAETKLNDMVEPVRFNYLRDKLMGSLHSSRANQASELFGVSTGDYAKAKGQAGEWLSILKEKGQAGIDEQIKSIDARIAEQEKLYKKTDIGSVPPEEANKQGMKKWFYERKRRPGKLNNIQHEINMLQEMKGKLLEEYDNPLIDFKTLNQYRKWNDRVKILQNAQEALQGEDTRIGNISVGVRRDMTNGLRAQLDSLASFADPQDATGWKSISEQWHILQDVAPQFGRFTAPSATGTSSFVGFGLKFDPDIDVGPRGLFGFVRAKPTLKLDTGTYKKFSKALGNLNDAYREGPNFFERTLSGLSQVQAPGAPATVMGISPSRDLRDFSFDAMGDLPGALKTVSRQGVPTVQAWVKMAGQVLLEQEAQAQGLVDALGNVKDQEGMLNLEAQIAGDMDLYTKAYQSGDKASRLFALSYLSKQYPNAFPPSESGFPGEVRDGNDRYLPDPQEQQAYVKQVIDEMGSPGNSVISSALKVAAMHRSMKIIDPSGIRRSKLEKTSIPEQNTLFSRLAGGDMDLGAYQDLIDEVLADNSLNGSLDPALVRAVIGQESGGKADAVSKAGAQGLMQLMPATGKEMHKKLRLKEAYNPSNPKQNLRLGTAYLGQMLDEFEGDTQLALAAYNAGPARVRAAIKKAGTSDFETVARYLPEETQAYVPSILSKLG